MHLEWEVRVELWEIAWNAAVSFVWFLVCHPRSLNHSPCSSSCLVIERETGRLGEISHSRDLVLIAGFVEQEDRKEIVAVCRAGDRLHSRSKEESSQSAALCISSSTFIMTATQEEKEWIKELIGGGGVMKNLHSANTAIDILLMH